MEDSLEQDIKEIREAVGGANLAEAALDRVEKRLKDTEGALWSLATDDGGNEYGGLDEWSQSDAFERHRQIARKLVKIN